MHNMQKLTDFEIDSLREKIDDLFAAVQNGILAKVQAALKAGAPLNARNHLHRTPLHVAVARNHLPVVIYLLNENTELNPHDNNGQTPLHVAVQINNEDILNRLLAAGAEVDARDNNQNTPLHHAAYKGYNTITRLLLKANAQIDALATNQSTPLFVAIQSDQPDMVKLLIDAGAALEIGDEGGVTPIHYAASKGNCTTIGHLLTAGVSLLVPTDEEATEQHYAAQNGHLAAMRMLVQASGRVETCLTTNNGMSVLHLASYRKYPDLVAYLLEAGFPVNLTDKFGATALHHASEEGHPDIVRCLLTHGASTSLLTKLGFTALHLAAKKNHPAVIQILLDSGVDVDQTTERLFCTALELAIENNCIDAARCLVANKAKVYLCDIVERSLAYKAAYAGHLELLQCLHQAGAIITYQHDRRYRLSLRKIPLHGAAEKGHEHVVNYLLDTKVPSDEQDFGGKTALHIAAANGHNHIVKRLMAAGCQLLLTSRNGQTALHYAAQNGHVDIANCLLEQGIPLFTLDREGRTALDCATLKQHYDVVHQLLIAGAGLGIAQFDPSHYQIPPQDHQISILVIGTDTSGQRITRQMLDFPNIITSFDELQAASNNMKYFPFSTLKRLSNAPIGIHKDKRIREELEQVQHFLRQSYSAQINLRRCLAMLLIAKEKNHNKSSLIALPSTLLTKISEFIAVSIGIRHGQVKQFIKQFQDNTLPLMQKRNNNRCLLHEIIKILNEINDSLIKIQPISPQSSSANIVITNFIKRIDQLSPTRIWQDALTHVIEEYSDKLIHSLEVIVSELSSSVSENYRDHLKNYIEILKAMLDLLAYFNNFSTGDVTVLHLAAERGQTDVIVRLLGAGISINQKKKNGETALHVAAEEGQAQVVKILVEAGIDVNAQNAQEMTALHIAVSKIDLVVVEYLLSAQPKLELLMKDGLTALDIATDLGNLEIYKRLRAAGAKVGRVSVHRAVRSTNLQLVEHQVSEGISLTSKSNEGITTLDAALQSGNLPIYKYLRVRGANFSRFSLFMAITSANLEVVQTLLAEGTSVVIRNLEGITPMHSAVYKGKAMVKLLHASGAILDEPMENGTTPLHLAAKDNYCEVILYLLKYDVRVNKQTEEGGTALHIAVHNHHIEAVNCLLRAGAGFGITNFELTQHLHNSGTLTPQCIVIGTMSEVQRITRKITGFEEQITSLSELQNAINRKVFFSNYHVIPLK